jgi:G:T-mismatch repair DNA endonuclease (very short patch repair protein)
MVAENTEVLEAIEKCMKTNTNLGRYDFKYNFILDNLYQFDFFIKDMNLIIETHGDYWHANPSKFVKSDMIHETLAYDIWERDAQRLEYLKNANYNVLVVWESDWDNYSDKIINECKNFLLYE